MADDFDSLHIKGRTAGSSNELSFDVLDAARSNLDGKQKKGGRGWRARRSQRGQHSPASAASVPKATSAKADGGRANAASKPRASVASLASAPEVAQRKKARRASSVRTWVLVILVLAVVVGAGTYFGYRYYQQRTDFATQFTTLMDELIDIDQQLVTVDILMKDPTSAVQSKQLTQALTDIPSLSDDLARVVKEANACMQNAHGDAEVEAFSEVVAAAEARQDLLDSAKGALQLFGRVNGQMAKADEALDDIVAGDELVRESAELANSATTEEATTAARDKTYEAVDKMTAALSAVGSLEETNKGLKLADWKAYLQKRLKALDFALQTSTALLAGNREEAAAANDSYNDAEKEAAELFSKLSGSLADQVRDYYEAGLESAVSDYKSARTHVTAVDADLRAK